MKIAIDARALIVGRRTGVEEYTLNLLNSIFEKDRKNEYILFSSGWKNENIFTGEENFKKLSAPNKLLNVSFKFLNYPKIDKWLGEVDLFFMPNINFVSLSNKCRNIITFHDLSFVKYPQFYSTKRRLWHKLINAKKLARKADKIIAVSQSTKDDLVSLFNIDEKKIKIVYSGIGEEFRPINKENNKLEEIRKKYKLPDKFILYLGTLEPRKNIVGLLQAFDLFKQKSKDTETKLVIAGRPGWLYKEIFKKQQELMQGKEVIFTGFIEVADKPYLYNLAELFVFPSFYEGFGFPPLEAIACGVPVIVSNYSSLPEVVADGAIMVDPYNVDELSWAMGQILCDKNLRKKLISAGISQAKKFSWQNCAEKMIKIFN